SRRRRHTRFDCDWSSDVCSSDLSGWRMLDRGAYLGFDRFWLELLHPDRARQAALIALLGVGFERQIVLSHDTVWCWRGRAPGVRSEERRVGKVGRTRREP